MSTNNDESRDDAFDLPRQPEVSGAFPSVSDQSGLKAEADDGDVIVVVTQAFDGQGNDLVHDDGPTFDGFPGVTLHVVAEGGGRADVTLSPIHGDPRKVFEVGFEELEPGTKCRLFACEGGPELDNEGPCDCGRNGSYYKLYLSPRGREGEVCLVCDVWDCHRSRIIDDSELFSWVDY